MRHQPNCPACRGTGKKPTGKLLPNREPETEPCDCYECQDCIGMKEHGCYCASMGLPYPGGPGTDFLDADDRGQSNGQL